MELWQLLKNIVQDPLLVCLLLISLVLAALSIPVYFQAIRPRRGTTEWMRKVDERHFEGIRLYALRGADVVWALLVAVCAACLRFCYLFFYLQLHRRANALQVLLSASNLFIQRILLCVIFALCVYFTVRLLFGKALPAICVALVGALTQNHNNDTAALLLLSILFFLCWMNARRDWVLRGVWLLLSLGFYALCLLTCWKTFWLSPLYAVGYVAVLIRRCGLWERQQRIGKLLLSLFTMLLVLPLGGIFLWILYARASGRAPEGIFVTIRNFSFYEQMIPVLKTKIYHLITDRYALLGHVVVYESFLFLLGLGACVPALHRLFRERDSKALLLLVLLAGTAVLWAMSGVYLMGIPLLLLLGQLWSVLCRRERMGFCILSCCVLMAVIVSCMLLHY